MMCNKNESNECCVCNFIKSLFTFRMILLLSCLACCGLLIGSYVIENVFGVIPCQLCILQRFTYFTLTGLFLIGAFHNPKNIGRYVYAFMNLLFSVLGILIAGRQIWIQHLPIDQLPECAPGLDRLLEIHPILEVIKIVFQGSSECHHIHFTVFNLPISNWSFIIFTGFALVSLFIIFGQKKRWI